MNAQAYTNVQTAVGFLGNGAQARELEGFIGSDKVAFRAVDLKYVNDSQNLCIDIATQDPHYLTIPVISAVGSPGLKHELVSSWNGQKYTNIIASPFVSANTQDWGHGVLIAPAAVVTDSVSLGNHVHLNIGATLSHDCVVGDFSTISPGAHIAGGVVMGSGTFIGIAATVSHNITICSGVLIGAGAVVISDITVPGTYVGNPARWVSDCSGWEALTQQKEL